jgi:hypothetical protein
MRSDLRGDLRHLDVLKTWPVKPSAVIRGNAVADARLTLCTWFALICATVFSKSAHFPAAAAERLSLAAAAVLAPALVAAQLTVHNAAAVLFPAWVSTGPQRPRGLDAMGQRLILLVGVILALIVMIGPGAIAGGIVGFVFYRFVGAVSLVPAAVVCLAIVAVWTGHRDAGRGLRPRRSLGGRTGIRGLSTDHFVGAGRGFGVREPGHLAAIDDIG